MDGAKEFSSNEAEALMKDAGINIEPSAPRRHEQNSNTERTNRTLIEMGRTMLIDAGLPEAFWAEAIRYAVYLKNRLPSKSCPSGMLSPYEAFYQHKPQLYSSHPFGCAAYVEIPGQLRQKLLSQPKAKPAVFLGCIEITIHQFCLYDAVRRTVIVHRDVSFIDNKSPAKRKSEPLRWDADAILNPQLPPVLSAEYEPVDMPKPTVSPEPPTFEGPTELLEHHSAPLQSHIPLLTVEPHLNEGEADFDYLSDVSDRLQDSQPLIDSPSVPVQRRSTRLEKQPSRHWDFERLGKDFVRFSKAENRFLGRPNSTAFQARRTDSAAPTIPQSAREARRSPHAAQWEEAMAAELQACQQIGIWYQIPFAPQSPTAKAKKHLRNRWVFKMKNVDGTCSTVTRKFKG
jgi:hypothetical protein